MPAPRKKPPRARRTTSRSDPPVLAARDLVKDYNSDGSQTRALDGVSVEVRRGAFLAVMGPSGSGKSTLLHLLGGLDSPTKGEVLVDGHALTGLQDRDITIARRTSVGFVFQFFNLVPVLTVRENIALPLVIAGEAPDSYAERLDDVIAQTGLDDCADKLPSQISGGQQQRTAIARAIFPKPAVVLADEPTGNLDTRTSHEVLRLLKQLQLEQGQTVVIVTHDPRAAAYGEEVIYLEDGRIRSRLDLSRSRSPRKPAAKDGSRRTRMQAQGGEKHAQAVLAWLQKLGA